MNEVPANNLKFSMFITEQFSKKKNYFKIKQGMVI